MMFAERQPQQEQDLPDTLDLEHAAADLEGREAADILGWAARRFGHGLTFGTGFGAEGCAIIDIIARHRLPIDIFTLDTGLLFPETYALWKRLERRYGLTIRRVAPELSVEDQAAVYGGRLWERQPDRCCQMRKVVPLTVALAGRAAWITAIRRDQTSARADARPIEWEPRFQVVKVNPLVAWTGADVHAYITRHGVPVNPLHERGYPSIGCRPCTSRVAAGEDARAGRWRGLGKTECGLHAPSGAQA